MKNRKGAAARVAPYWGHIVVWSRDHKQRKEAIHVAPCGKFGKITNNHTTTTDCFCKPVQKPFDSVPPIYVHNDEKCGGEEA